MKRAPYLESETCVQGQEPTLTNSGTWTKSAPLRESLDRHWQSGKDTTSHKGLQETFNETVMDSTECLMNVQHMVKAQYITAAFISLLGMAVREICFRRIGRICWRQRPTYEKYEKWELGTLLYGVSCCHFWQYKICQHWFFKQGTTVRKFSKDCIVLFRLCRIRNFSDGTIEKVRQIPGKYTYRCLWSLQSLHCFLSQVTFFIASVLNPCISDVTVKVKRR